MSDVSMSLFSLYTLFLEISIATCELQYKHTDEVCLPYKGTPAKRFLSHSTFLPCQLDSNILRFYGRTSYTSLFERLIKNITCTIRNH